MKNFMLKNKKAILNTVIILAIAACIIAVIAMYNNYKNQPYTEGGIYYTQNGDGKYIQFLKDKTFSYVYDPMKDASKKLANEKNNQVEILNRGTWERKGDKLIITFEKSNTSVTFLEKDGYIYREDKVFRGITSDAKLLQNKYLYKESDERRDEAWFLSDGTMSYDSYWGSSHKSRFGKYTRVDDILIVRYDDSADIAHRFLVLDKGIVQDIYSKTEAK